MAHGIVGALVVGLLTHHAIWMVNQTNASQRFRQVTRRFLHLSLFAVIIELILGLLIYPTYRVRVRAVYFDQLERGWQPLHWLSGLFDFKEHAAAVLLAVCVALLLGDRLQDEVLAQRFPSIGGRLQQFLSVFGAILAWVVAVIGLWVTSHRGLPQGGG